MNKKDYYFIQKKELVKKCANTNYPPFKVIFFRLALLGAILVPIFLFIYKKFLAD